MGVMGLFVRLIYNVFLFPVLFILLNILSFLSTKVQIAFFKRYSIFSDIRSFTKTPGQRSILIHAASMGEFEHIKPLIGKLKETYPHSKITVTFFSPSGFNNVKSFKGVNQFLYLPFDFPWVMKRFYKIIRPDALIIAKYDLWPNMVWQASKLEIPIFIVNAALAKNSNRFKGLSYLIHREIYKHLTEIWISSEEDSSRFSSLAQDVKISITGDTKFDQVIWRRENAKRNEIIDDSIIKNKRVFIAGSIWPQDWDVLIPAFDKLIKTYDDLIIILVPHEPTDSHIEEIESKLEHTSIRFSRVSKYKNEKFIVVNRIGVLASMYAKANFAYVGGSFKQNIHNVLEPAVFGIPVFYGPVHKNSFEAVELNNAGGSIVVDSTEEFIIRFEKILKSEDEYKSYCNIANLYTIENKGASDKVIYRLKEYLS